MGGKRRHEKLGAPPTLGTLATRGGGGGFLVANGKRFDNAPDVGRERGKLVC
jgi:hypothetical protein